MSDKYIVLTHDMIKRTDLTMQEKIIYLEILNLSSLDKGCIASNKHFEECFGISKKSVSNTISNLIEKGFIKSKLSDRNHTRILSIKDGCVSTKDGCVSTKDGESKENKTINNKINKKEEIIKFLKSSNLETINKKSLQEWLEYKEWNYKTVGIGKLIKMLSKYGIETQAEMIDNSIMNNYKGIFEIKQNTKISNNVTDGEKYVCL